MLSPHCHDSNRRFQFDKSGQLFIGTHNEAMISAAMRIRNEIQGYIAWEIHPVMKLETL